MPTARQIGRLYNLARLCGIDHDTCKQELAVVYGVASSKDLSAVQYEEYTAHLQHCANAMARGRNLPPEAAQVRPGMYASAEHLQEYSQAVADFGRAWPGQMSDQDVRLLAILLDKFRLYRARDRQLSQKQLDDLVAALAKFPLGVFRAAGNEYLAKYTTKPEKYFLGIMKGMMRDEASKSAAAARGSLQLI